MSFLEKEAEKPSTMWDWVIGIALLLLVGGFAVFYQYQKRLSRERFNAANALFDQGKYREAAKAYEQLKNAQYLTTAHDSTIYARLDSVETLEDVEKETVGHVRSKLAAGDTAGAKNEIRSQTFHGLLSPSDQAYLDSVKSRLQP